MDDLRRLHYVARHYRPLQGLRLLPLTCAQAWAVSNRNFDGMVAIVKALAHVSLLNRDLTFPNTREAGLEAGKAIAAGCKADPNALLFSLVDAQVKLIATR